MGYWISWHDAIFSQRVDRSKKTGSRGGKIGDSDLPPPTRYVHTHTNTHYPTAQTHNFPKRRKPNRVQLYEMKRRMVHPSAFGVQ